MAERDSTFDDTGARVMLLRPRLAALENLPLSVRPAILADRELSSRRVALRANARGCARQEVHAPMRLDSLARG